MGKGWQLRLVVAATVAAGARADVVGAFSSAQLSGLTTHHPRRLDTRRRSAIKVRDEDEEQRDFFRRRRRRKNLEHWGVERLASPPSFPSTFEEVADEAFYAIAGTICGLQRPDPNFASNAMHRSVLDYRPTQPKWASRRRWTDGDDHDGMVLKRKPPGKEKKVPVRMGIEIDGAAHLLSGQSNDEGRAMRILSLRIAERLSALPWDVESNTGPRSVAVYFNSVDQSLLASRKLRRWKVQEGENDVGSLDHIHIHCLGQDPLPPSMVKQKRRRDDKGSGDSEHANRPDGGILLIVKPTDCDTASLIPIHHGHSHSSHVDARQPAIQANVVDKLQSLLFQASASSIPAVVISPRLSELPPLQQLSDQYKRTGPSGFEQSGFQKSATYGGLEPPVGPTSWLLRDLVPPVYVWVGCANFIGQRQHSRRSLRSVAASFNQQQRDEDNSERTRDHFGGEDAYSYYSGVALTQSAMEAGHSWHMFVVEERLSPLPRDASRKAEVSETHPPSEVRDVAYHYMGSSSTARGRPSRRVMHDAFVEFTVQ